MPQTSAGGLSRGRLKTHESHGMLHIWYPPDKEADFGPRTFEFLCNLNFQGGMCRGRPTGLANKTATLIRTCAVGPGSSSTFSLGLYSKCKTGRWLSVALNPKVQLVAGLILH